MLSVTSWTEARNAVKQSKCKGWPSLQTSNTSVPGAGPHCGAQSRASHRQTPMPAHWSVVRVSCHCSHTNYVSDKSLFLMSMSSNIHGKDNGTSAVTVPEASGLLLPVCQAEPPVLLQPGWLLAKSPATPLPGPAHRVVPHSWSMGHVDLGL